MEEHMGMSYGQELILDVHYCNSKKFTRNNLKQFFILLCKEIDMERCDLHFWDYEGHPEEYKKAPIHLKGISAVQFISTSNITIHTLDKLEKVFINIFSCKAFDGQKVINFVEKYFEGHVRTKVFVDRR